MKYIYRMTHIDNIPHILKYGITHSSSLRANPDYKSIGDKEIIEKRSRKEAYTINHELFIPGEFIPFYFYARMPMLYNIQHGYKVTKIDPSDIVYLVVDLLSIIQDKNRGFFFSDGHVISGMTKFYGRESIGEIDTILDKEAILAKNWADDYVIRERKQAEFLVKGDIPIEYVTHIVCYDEMSKTKLKEMGVNVQIVIGGEEAYY